MNEVEQRQQKITQEFILITNWEDRYKKLIEKGKNLKSFPEESKIEKFRVHGCQSVVYLTAELKNGKVKFEATSDALIVGGLVSLLLEVYSDASPEEIVKNEPKFISDIGLEKHLSPSRANGLRAMLKQMKMYAYALMMQQEGS